LTEANSTLVGIGVFESFRYTDLIPVNHKRFDGGSVFTVRMHSGLSSRFDQVHGRFRHPLLIGGLCISAGHPKAAPTEDGLQLTCRRAVLGSNSCPSFA
jgi:hypothetical protein